MVVVDGGSDIDRLRRLGFGRGLGSGDEDGWWLLVWRLGIGVAG